jgi:hypothetical protein
MIKIDTNLIPLSVTNFIEDLVKNKTNHSTDRIAPPFSFFYQESMTYNEPSGNDNDVGFSNCFIADFNSLYNFDYASCMENILYKVCSHYNIFVNRIHEGRIFLQPPSKFPLEQQLHVDIPDVPLDAPFYSLIYYISDSDGDTVFYKGDKEIKRVTPKKGTTVLFDGHLFHRGIKPINKTKILLNFSFFGTPYN